MAAKRFFCIKTVLFSILFALSVNAFAAYSKLVIQDNADLLNDDEELQLNEIMKPVLEFGGVAFVTNKDDYDGEASDLAYYYCHSFFNGESGVVFLVDMAKRRIEFYSTGEIYDKMGRLWSDIIADNIYKHASNEEYFICAQQAFTQMITILNGGKVGAPMRYVSSVLLAIAITLLVMYFILYSSRKKAHFGKRVDLLKGSSDKDVLVKVLDKKLVNVVRVQHSSSSGRGGGRSSFGGGGGSRGGGGGHGF